MISSILPAILPTVGKLVDKIFPVDRSRKVASGIAPHGNYFFPAKILGIRRIEVRHLLANVQ